MSSRQIPAVPAVALDESLDPVRRAAQPAGVPPAKAARLPFLALKTLRERGIVSGSVLLLAERMMDLTTLPSMLGNVSQPKLTLAMIRDAAQINTAAFDAVVLILEEAAPIKPLLSVIAQRTPPGVTLVLIQGVQAGSAAACDREALHLMLLGAGFDRFWAHEQRPTLRVSAQRAAPARARICSIIVPVYNERHTFPLLMQALLAKPLAHLGLEREIIIVESNSTDGSREQVARFAATPGVKLLWQERPRGKGHAVRAGLREATGDIVLIQDADLEYDVNDYDALLMPLLEGRAAFVLGSRHSGQAAMRVFTDQRLIGHICNGAHVCFTTLLNVLYRQSMRDPFTMFKVFRRDCLYGLKLECNRFDFDHELVIKLLLKGYRPLEIPVAYRSRSFKQGKKIRPFSDPFNWIAADLRYRLTPLKPHFDP